MENESCGSVRGKKLKPCGTTAAYVRGCRCNLCRAAINEKSRQYRAKNPGRVKEKQAYWANRDRNLEQMARYREANRDVLREKEAQRRTRATTALAICAELGIEL